MRFMFIGLRLPGPSPPPAPFQVCGAPQDKNPREVFKEQKIGSCPFPYGTIFRFWTRKELPLGARKE